jgi:CspA family cold shock protein
MNPTAKRIVISFISTLAAFILIGLIQDNLSGTTAALATFIIIFAAVLFGAFTGGSPAKRKRQATSTASSSSASASHTEGDGETGTVKWFNVKKGYGFITRDSGDDVFVHYRNIVGSGRRSIADGQRVSFIVVDGDKGLQADEVETI